MAGRKSANTEYLLSLDQVKRHTINWNQSYNFSCKLYSRIQDAVLDPCPCRISIIQASSMKFNVTHLLQVMEERTKKWNRRTDRRKGRGWPRVKLSAHDRPKTILSGGNRKLSKKAFGSRDRGPGRKCGMWRRETGSPHPTGKEGQNQWRRMRNYIMLCWSIMLVCHFEV